jgi:hypothetical protein
MKGNDGFVSVNQDQHKKLKNTKYLNAIGRPKKSEEDRQQVESMRFSLKEKNILTFLAKRHGCDSWKKYVKLVVMEHSLDELSHIKDVR